MGVGNFKAKRRFGGYALEAKSIVSSFGKTATKAEKKFVLFGRGRSGSTLLVQMLDSNPAIGCLDEILRFTTFSPVRMIERELGRLDKPVRGFKLLSYQIRELHSRHDQRLKNWMADESVTILHLRRENVLRHAISNIYAQSRQAYHSTDSGSVERKRVTIDPDELFGWMQGSLDLLTWEQRYLGDLERDEICYERDLATPDTQAATLRRVSDTLGVDPVPAQVSLSKVTPRDFDTFVENWSALREAIARSEFRKYLDLPG